MNYFLFNISARTVVENFFELFWVNKTAGANFIELFWEKKVSSRNAGEWLQHKYFVKYSIHLVNERKSCTSSNKPWKNKKNILSFIKPCTSKRSTLHPKYYFIFKMITTLILWKRFDVDIRSIVSDSKAWIEMALK